MKELTSEEIKAIRKLRNALKTFPKSLRIYNCDSTLVVCKIGISCMDITEYVGDISTGYAVIMDAHDDVGYANETS